MVPITKGILRMIALGRHRQKSLSWDTRKRIKKSLEEPLRKEVSSYRLANVHMYFTLYMALVGC